VAQKKTASKKRPAAKKAAKPAKRARASRPPAKKRAAARPAARKPAKRSAPAKPAKRTKPAKKAAAGTGRTAAKPAPKSTAPAAATATRVAPQAPAVAPTAAARPMVLAPATRPAAPAASPLVKPHTAPRPVASSRANAGRSVARTAASRAASSAAPTAPVVLDLAQIRARLAAKREEILALYRKDLKTGQESNDSPTEDIVDRANNAYSRELNFSISDAERARLLEIEEALSRLDLGTYGRCAHCGQPISAARLAAVPWAKLCVQCQELLEKGMLPEG
jgi:DnaK suppressor protein